MISFRRARAAHVNAEDDVTKGGKEIAGGVGQGEKPREGRFELLGTPIACGGEDGGNFGFGRETAREVEVNGEASPIAHGDVQSLLGGAFVGRRAEGSGGREGHGLFTEHATRNIMWRVACSVLRLLVQEIFHHLLKLFRFFEECPVSALGEFDGLAVGECGAEFIGDGTEVGI